MNALSKSGDPSRDLSPANNNLDNVYIRSDVVHPDSWVLHKTDGFHICNNKSLFTRLDLKDPTHVQNEYGFVGVQALGIGQVSVPIWTDNGAPSRLTLHDVYFAPRSSISSISFIRCTKTDGFCDWTEIPTGVRMNRVSGLSAVYFDNISARVVTMRLPGDVDGNPFFGIHPPVHSERDPFASRFPIVRQPGTEALEGIQRAMVPIRRLMELKRAGQHGNKEAKLLEKRSITGVTVGDIVRMLDWDLPYRMYPQEKVYLSHPDRRPWASHLYVKPTPYAKSTPRRDSRNDGQETGSEHTLSTNISTAGDTAAS